MAVEARPKFVAGEEQLDECVRQAKFWPCPRCGRVGTLVGHGLLVGYGEDGGFPVVRRRRFFWSNRHRQRGCGRTFSVLLDSVLRGFVVRALTLVAAHLALGARHRLLYSAYPTPPPPDDETRVAAAVVATIDALRYLLAEYDCAVHTALANELPF